MQKTMRLIIAGGRDFKDNNLFLKSIEAALANTDLRTVEVVSGKCPTGADHLGEKWAKEKGLPVAGFPANWDIYGKYAGPLRNENMAKYATHCICFWDGKSRGTANMIDMAKKHNIKLKIIRY